MKAIVLGATGAVGLDLVEMLLKDDAFSEVEVFCSPCNAYGKC